MRGDSDVTIRGDYSGRWAAVRSDTQRPVTVHNSRMGMFSDSRDPQETSALVEPRAADFAEAATIFPRRGGVSRL